MQARQTMQQRRAKSALEAIEACTDKNYQGELKSYLQAMPAMIHMNGLGQAAAFHCSKKAGKGPKAEAKAKAKAEAYGKAYHILSRWLCSAGQPYAGADDLMQAITRGDMADYRLAQAEAMAYLDWVKKFAAAFLQGEAQS